jgi:hypothetical protein
MNQANLLNKMYSSGLISFDEQRQGLDDARSNIQAQMKQMRNSYATAKTNLATQRDDTLNSQSMYFSQIAPDAYQSQQDVYSNKVKDNYNTGLQDVENTYAENQRQQSIAERQLANQYGSLARAKEASKANLAAQQEALRSGAVANADEFNQANPGYNVTIPSFNSKPIDITKYANTAQNLQIGNLLKGGQFDNNKMRSSMIRAIMSDPTLTDEEKDYGISAIDNALGYTVN